MEPTSSPVGESAVVIQAVEVWLRRCVRGEMAFHTAEALLMAVFGIVILAVETWMVEVVLVFTRMRPPFHWDDVPWWLNAWSIFLLVCGLSYGAWWKHREDQLQMMLSNRDDILIASVLKPSDYSVFEILAGGITRLVSALESWRIARELSRVEPGEVAPLMAWLWASRSKKSCAEIARRFPGLNFVRIFSQLRHLPGVVWLPKPRGVVILTGELRVEMSRHLNGLPADSELDPALPLSPTNPSEGMEILDWYATLGLPPFAALPDVKRRYRQLAKRFHPDARAGRGDSGIATSDEEMKRVNAAYESIMKMAGV